MGCLATNRQQASQQLCHFPVIISIPSGDDLSEDATLLMTVWGHGAAEVGQSADRLCSVWQVEWSGEVQQLSWAPRLFLYKGFLSDEECDHLIEMVIRPNACTHTHARDASSCLT